MDQSAQAALRLLDKLLTERPEKVGHDFSEATRSIATYRDRLVADWRCSENETTRQSLAQVNGVLSVVLGGHYPLGEIPWPHIERARAVLADVARRDTTDAG